MLRRIPRLVVLSWALAVAVLAVLGTAVGRHLAAGSASGGSAMLGMHMGTADALSRGTASTPSVSLTLTRLFTTWQLDAVSLAVLVVLAAAYLTAVALVPVRSPGERWPVRTTVAFLAGLAVCGYATNGAIAVYDQVLFSAHMAGHLALVMVAPALLIAGRPFSLVLAAAAPARRARWAGVLRSRLVAVLTAPPVALATYAAVIVGSHLTGLMDTIMRNTWAGQLEHVVYVLAGCQFFVLVIGAEPVRWRLGSPARWLLLAIAMAVDTFTGIVLMQGTSQVQLLPSALHVDALSDTHTGGAIMWFGGDAIMALIMIGLVVQWLRTADVAPVERGWLEQARGAAFAEHTGLATASTPGSSGGFPDSAGLDDSEDARLAYNDWLARLERR